MNRPLLLLSLVIFAVSCGSPSVEPVGSRGQDGLAEVAPATSSGSLDSGRRPDLPEGQLASIRQRENERAQRALDEVEARFADRSPGLTFRIHRVRTTSLGDTHVLIQQVYRGVPVERRDILVVVMLDESIRIFGSPDSFEGLTLPPARRLANAEQWAKAKGVALAGSGERTLVPVFERRLRPGARGDNAMDYETVVSRFESGTRIAVDADPAWKGARALFLRDRDGAVFERELPGAAYEDATLQGQYAQTSKYIKTYRDEKGMYYLKDVWGNSVKAKTLNGTYVYRAADNAWGDGQPYAAAGVGTVNGETAAADALISVWANAMTYQHIYSNITFQPIQVWVHEPVTGAFSWADTNNVWHIELGYKDPSAIIKTPMTDIETVAHEAGHHVLRDTAGVISYTLMGEQGGIIEGCADIFGINASFYLPDALHPTCYGLNQICLWSNVLQIKNDWIFGNITGLPSALRSFVDPTVPAWSPSIANVTAHSAGGPLRRMYYFLSVGVLPLGTTPGAPSWDLPQRDSIFLPQGMTGIGVDEASRIWWQTINGLYFSGVTDYVGLRTAMLNAASVLYGKPHTPQYKAVEDAWAAVNVGPPADRDPPVVTLTEVQKSRTLAEITVDIAPDPSGISSGTVTIMSGFSVPPPTVASCTSHCVFTFARPSTTPGAATASGWRSPTVPETPR